MFKNGECYDLVSKQGAAGYIGGTGTFNERKGNEKNGIPLPFVPYPRSHAASNWLGLPNDGDIANAERATKIIRNPGCPIGWSNMGSPDFKGLEKQEKLVLSMKLYKGYVDFLEINESCPNTEKGKPQDKELEERLRYVQENFLKQRKKELPVIVKFSNDTPKEQVKPLLDLLFKLEYDGINFGNTSTKYEDLVTKMDPFEHRLYHYFTIHPDFGVGGGVSGRPLKEKSLELVSIASQYLKAGPPRQEFHIIRTGGIETAQDLIESDKAGASMNQWFTGYFEAFSRHGNNVYKNIYEEYNRLKKAK